VNNMQNPIMSLSLGDWIQVIIKVTIAQIIVGIVLSLIFGCLSLVIFGAQTAAFLSALSQMR